MKILLIGIGGFGRNHLRAWHDLGLGDQLYVADLSPNRWEECRKYNLPPERVTADYAQFLNEVDVVDIVTPTDQHYDLCRAALEAGKDVFIEKPLAMTSVEAAAIRDLVAETGRMLQIGYYYRFHPLSQHVKKQIDAGALGQMRYISGNFMGFKRARTDVGVTHTDGIHFLDLFNWLLGSFPEEVYAVVRDHFGRGLEDMSIVLMRYPDGVVGKVESGYIQPGHWKDKVVPGAMTNKEFAAIGSQATIEVDFESEELVHHDVHHEERDGVWWAANAGSTRPNVGTANTVQMICNELASFLECVQTRRTPGPNAEDSGVALARLIEAIYTSGREGRPVRL